MQYIVDAWLLVELLNGNAEAKAWLEATSSNVHNQVIIPSICVVEAGRVGLREGKKREDVNAFIDRLFALHTISPNVTTFGITKGVAKEAARLSRHYDVGIADLIVLASAKERSATIKTALDGDVAKIARSENIRAV